MATKYWYKAANGSDNWATAANWYLGSAGTGGTTTVPTAADDVFIDSNSGSGTLTIAAAATCLSLTLAGFTGTLAGTSSTLSVVNILQFGSSMTLTYTGTITFPTSTGAGLYSSGKTIGSSITINIGAANTFYFNDNTTFLSTTTLTLTSGNMYINSITLNIGLFVSTGAVARYITGAGTFYVNGIGTVWNVTGTLFGIDLASSPYPQITDSSSSSKTITNTATTAPAGTPPSGNPSWNFQPVMVISGSGTGSYTITGNFYEIDFNNTGVANVSFGTSTIYYALNFISSYVNWNNGATTITFNTDLSNLVLSPNMTITTSAALSITNPGSLGFVYFQNFGKYLTATITINGSGAQSGLYAVDTFYSTGTVTLTAGFLGGGYAAYIGLISSSNSNTRTISFVDLYLIGIGTVLTTTTSTNLSFSVNNIYVINSSVSAKTLILSSVVYPSTGIYLGGTGSGPITYTPGTGTPQAFLVNVTNTGGAVVNISAATNIYTLDFGTSSCIWTNTTLITVTFWNLYLSPNMTITACPTLLWNGSYQGEIRCYGKSITNLTVNDTNLLNYIFFVTGDLYVSGTLTLTSGTFYVYNAGLYGGTFSGIDRGFQGPTYSQSAYEDVYVGNFTSAAGSAARTLVAKNMYFSGTTAITSTSVAGLAWQCDNMYLTNSSGSARSITLNATIYPLYAVYIAGTASGTTTITPGTLGSFDIIVTNTGACVISLATSTIKSLIFATGSNAVWTNTATQTLTIQANLIIYSAGTPTLTPALIFNGVSGLGSIISLSGKSLVTGAVTLNDTAYSAGAVVFTVTSAFSTNSTFTITSANYVQFDGSFNGTSFVSTACNSTVFNSTLTLTGGVTLANNAYSNNLILNGTASFTTLSHLAYGLVTINAPTSITTSTTINNSSGFLSVAHYNTLTTPILTITNGIFYSFGTASLNVTGALTLTTGQIVVNGSSNYNLGSFVSSGTTTRIITMGNGTWTLTGTVGATASYTIWNVVATNIATFTANASLINITDSSNNNVNFTGGSLTYYGLQLNRAGSTASTTLVNNNTFTNFIDIGTATHSIIFTAASTQTIGHFAVNGSPSVQITLNSTTLATFSLVKSPTGFVNCDFLNIQHCVASPSTLTWYAGTNSVNNQAVSGAGSGWIFTNMPPRKLGAGGVG